MPEGFRHVAWNDLDALAAAVDPSVAAVLLEPMQGEGGVNPATAEYLQGVRAAVRRARPAVHGRRGPDRLRPHRPLVRLPARRHRARRRDDGQGARQRLPDRRGAGPSATSPPPSSPATTAAPTAARRSPPRRPSAVIGEMRRHRRAGAGRRAGCPPGGAACGPIARRRRGPRARPAARRRARRRASTPRRCPPACLDAGLVVNAVTPTALRLAPPLTVSRRRDRRGGRDARQGAGG